MERTTDCNQPIQRTILSKPQPTSDYTYNSNCTVNNFEEEHIPGNQKSKSKGSEASKTSRKQKTKREEGNFDIDSPQTGLPNLLLFRKSK